jgi:hypothetical protein
MNDTDGIDAVVHSLYDTISGPAGEERDWDRFRTLFAPGARLIRTSIGSDGAPHALAMDVHQYEANVTDLFLRESFYEIEIARRVDVFGNVAHVFSTYEARHEMDDAEPFKRGINSIQLFHDGNRWCVMNMLWDNEREDNPLPDEYLPHS